MHTSLNPYHSFQISVNASILKDSGGTCVCPTGDGCFTDPEYATCVAEIQRDLITTTAAVSALASALMGALANLPVGLAPGLGLNAYVSIHFSPSSDLSMGPCENSQEHNALVASVWSSSLPHDSNSNSVRLPWSFSPIGPSTVALPCPLSLTVCTFSSRTPLLASMERV